MTHYRKIYEQNYGSIPQDKDGRTYEIHHIDGNHKNDSLENLIAITIQEHYNIHFAQGDWGACQSIALRMKKLPEEISKICRELALKRVAVEAHPFLSRPDGTNLQTDRIVAGTHNFLGGEIQGKTSRRRVKERTHNFIGSSGNKKMLELGIHPSQQKKTCEHCDSKISVGNYSRHIIKCKRIKD